ncbi:MAG TPA: CPCC family cysteine-rich protein [Actinophytocola sp.]|uniref:CPCC family cysteine-rich protein n=1 Tax=Actinophytocola sp. TaxID=1872138 RepID=UPI002E0902D8|nr:CPCC family cysteine-rich protein [Actinophytocola sp.]
MLTPDKDRRRRRRTSLKHRQTSIATMFGERFVNVSRPAGNGPYACPCCGYLTLDARGGHEICPVCFWEDDGQDDHDATAGRGGPNKDLSLTQARANFAAFGASAARRLGHVRPPHDGEHPLDQAPTGAQEAPSTT